MDKTLRYSKEPFTLCMSVRMHVLPWLGQRMMPTEQMLQGNRISLRLISVFSPTHEFEDM